MAKESMKAREVKRAKLVAKYAEKKKQLKAEGNYDDYCTFTIIVDGITVNAGNGWPDSQHCAKYSTCCSSASRMLYPGSR